MGREDRQPDPSGALTGGADEPVIKRLPQPGPGADQMRVQLIVPMPTLPQDFDQLVRGIQPGPIRELEAPLGNGVEKRRLSLEALPDMRKRPFQQGRTSPTRSRVSGSIRVSAMIRRIRS